MSITFGKIELEHFNGLTSMPQKYASAWDGAFEHWVGSSYKPLLCVGKQIVEGVNYYFIAEQTLTTHPPLTRIVCLAINEFNGKYKVASVEEILK